MTNTKPLLQIKNLNVSFPSEFGKVNAVRDLSLDLMPGEVLGIVGESGSGKSVTSLAAIGLLPPSASISGQILYDNKNLLELNDNQLSKYRGKDLAMIFQDPLSALNPVKTIGNQISESLLIHQDVSTAQATKRSIELLDVVGIPKPNERIASYAHEFSGGMRQRVMIALAIANQPKILFADEPTTALDVTVQAQILEVLKHARDITGATVVLVTHDLGVVAGLADRVAIMYAGKIVESGPVSTIYSEPKMPYTIGLLKSVPRLDAAPGTRLASIPGSPPSPTVISTGCAFSDRCPVSTSECETSIPNLIELEPYHHAACIRTSEISDLVANGKLFGSEVHASSQRQTSDETVLEISGLKKTFPLLKGAVLRRRVGSVFAVDGIDLRLNRGESLALVGESGCGKTTTLIEIMNLVAPQDGRISFLGKDVSAISMQERRSLRKDLQIVFQDPFASLDPRLPIGDAIAEPLQSFGYSKADQNIRITELLELVGLNPAHASRFPAEFSGGQRQRIAIARALALEPSVVVLDEPVSALDVSVRAGILNLLSDLQRSLNMSYLFVSHDLAVVRHVADRVAVMYLGSIVEQGLVDDVFSNPSHPYTQALLSAIPIPDPAIESTRVRILLEGDLPSPANPPSGCRFHTRCHVRQLLPADKQEQCAAERPLPRRTGSEKEVACHFPLVSVS